MFLIDTHALIWAITNDDKLSEKAAEAIRSGVRVCVSIASLWEIAIKQNIGKLDLDLTVTEIANACAAHDIEILPIEPRHLDKIKTLPKIHGDPFDRILLAQAEVEKLAIVTKDTIIPKYGLETIW